MALLAFTRSSLDPALLFSTLLLLVAALQGLRCARPERMGNHDSSEDYVELAQTVAAAFCLTALFPERILDIVPAVGLFLGIAAIISFVAHRLSMRGVIWTAGQVTMLVVSGLWGWAIIAESAHSWVAQAFLGVSLAFGWLFSAVNLLAAFAREALTTHESWRLPVAAPGGARPGKFQPFVSLHLPCYAEPPHVVMETMNRLARLSYDNFEVLVCDNNTKDERLWRPLEEHSQRLNRQLGREVFRFFHVSPLPGAKAGALNFLLEKMAQETLLVGLVDADYYSRPDFLSRLVPFFENPEIGYVQTPHDYRDWSRSDYLTACYWEYMPSNKVDYPGISEYGGAFTIGTMCLFRAGALKRAGRWAEWCLTEDSEVSVRLRAAGYRGYYLSETFGRGLIPETIDDYKKQRFRWTAGPVQQLRRHWRLFMPWAPALPGWTKLLEVVRCAAPLVQLAGVSAAVAGVLLTGITVALGLSHPVKLPEVSWLLLMASTLTWGARTVQRYRLAGCERWQDMIRGEIARAALDYTVLTAGIAGLSSRPLAWRRTPKFAVDTLSNDSPLAETMQETIAGGICMGLALLVLALSGLWGTSFAAMIALGFVVMGLRFFCAPLLAYMGIAHVQGVSASAPSLVSSEPREAREG